MSGLNIRLPIQRHNVLCLMVLAQVEKAELATGKVALFGGGGGSWFRFVLWGDWALLA